MKKTGDRKSRDTLALNLFYSWLRYLSQDNLYIQYFIRDLWDIFYLHQFATDSETVMDIQYLQKC